MKNSERALLPHRIMHELFHESNHSLAIFVHILKAVVSFWGVLVNGCAMDCRGKTPNFYGFFVYSIKLYYFCNKLFLN